jgi:hypothetical protein
MKEEVNRIKVKKDDLTPHRHTNKTGRVEVNTVITTALQEESTASRSGQFSFDTQCIQRAQRAHSPSFHRQSYSSSYQQENDKVKT